MLRRAETPPHQVGSIAGAFVILNIFFTPELFFHCNQKFILEDIGNFFAMAIWNVLYDLLRCSETGGEI